MPRLIFILLLILDDTTKYSFVSLQVRKNMLLMKKERERKKVEKWLSNKRGKKVQER